LDKLGNLYGTTVSHGAYGWGLVFKLDPAGNETVLYTFTGATDGGNPLSSLALDAQGNLYGTTAGGRDISCESPYGCGTVFKLDTAGNGQCLKSAGSGL
jgi:uncharacterized repeat protein (TIGR03803 family)